MVITYHGKSSVFELLRSYKKQKWWGYNDMIINSVEHSRLGGGWGDPYDGLQTVSGQQHLHLLGQNSCCRLLLDEIVAAIYLQLSFQVRGWMEILAVFSRAPTLHSEMREQKRDNLIFLDFCKAALATGLISDVWELSFIRRLGATQPWKFADLFSSEVIKLEYYNFMWDLNSRL